MQLLKPKLDIVFRMLFSSEKSKPALKAFLQSVLDLEEDEYDELEVTNPLLESEYPTDKQNILDIKLKTKSGKKIDVEIQLNVTSELRPRITYYLSHMITEQLSRGSDYNSLQKSVCVIITDEKFIAESPSYHNVFRMLEVRELFPFDGLTEINVLDLTKIPRDDSSDLVKWMKFLRAEKEDEFEMIVQGNTALNEAYLRLKELSADEKTRMLADAREKALRDERMRLRDAKREGEKIGEARGEKIGEARGEKIGEARGKTEGIYLGQAQMIQNMINMGKSVKEISDFTGMGEIEIDKIIH